MTVQPPDRANETETLDAALYSSGTLPAALSSLQALEQVELQDKLADWAAAGPGSRPAGGRN